MRQIVFALALYAFLFAVTASLFASTNPYTLSASVYDYNPSHLSEDGLILKTTVAYEFQPSVTADIKLGWFDERDVSLNTVMIGITKNYPWKDVPHLNYYASFYVGQCFLDTKNTNDNGFGQELVFGLDYTLKPSLSMFVEASYLHAHLALDASDTMLGIGFKYHF